MDHSRGVDEIDCGPERRRGGKAMIGDFGAIEEEKIVRAVGDPCERGIGIVRVEFDLAFGPKQRGADCAAKIEIEAGGRVVGRRIDESWTGRAAAANDARGLDAIDDRAGVSGEGQSEDDCDADAPT